MSWRVLGFVAAAVGGIALFAWGGASAVWPAQIAGLALVLVCLAAAWRWFERQHRPPPIKPSANPAWAMRDHPPPGVASPSAAQAPVDNRPRESAWSMRDRPPE